MSTSERPPTKIRHKILDVANAIKPPSPFPTEPAPPSRDLDDAQLQAAIDDILEEVKSYQYPQTFPVPGWSEEHLDEEDLIDIKNVTSGQSEEKCERIHRALLREPVFPQHLLSSSKRQRGRWSDWGVH